MEKGVAAAAAAAVAAAAAAAAVAVAVAVAAVEWKSEREPAKKNLRIWISLLITFR